VVGADDTEVRDPLLPVGDGHTPLSDEDLHGLTPSYITTRGELYDAEQRNIAQALLRRAPSAAELLDDRYLRELHGAMFGNVWSWAGKYRKTETNLGVEPSRISADVRALVDDARAWVEHRTYKPTEIAVRFHHRLVAVHPFPNGNGRHGRAAADLLVAALGDEQLTWGRRRGASTTDLRAAYLGALRRADAGTHDELLRFARS